MNEIAACACAVLMALVTASHAADAPSTQPTNYKILKTLAVGGDGAWDYLTVDPDLHRLYVARSDHVQVLDADSGKLIHDYSNTKGVHGVTLVPQEHSVFTSNGQTGNISCFYYTGNFHKRGDVHAGKNPDFIIYDPSSTILVANHDSGSITFVFMFSKTLNIGGELEAIAIDGNSHAWVNVEDKNQVVEFNTNARNIVNCWPITGGQQPTGIAMDPQKRRLFIGCRGNNVMVIMNSDNGKILATLPIGQQCDGCAFDPATGDAFASCGDGTLAVVEETSPEKFTVVQTVQTKPGARTMCLDTKSHLIYLPTAEIDPINGNIKPNSFEILVVGK